MQRLGFLSTLSSGLLSKTLKISVSTEKSIDPSIILSLQGFLFPPLQGEVYSFAKEVFTRILGKTLLNISPRSVVILPNIYFRVMHKRMYGTKQLFW